MKQFIKKYKESISTVVGIGTPPLVLTGMTAGSSFAGGAAITTSLAITGVGLGMVAGVTILGAIGFGVYKGTKRLIKNY